MSTDAQYNEYSRHIEIKLEIYFDGLAQPPLVVTKDDYIRSFNLLEETGDAGYWPLGQVSANEISFKLFNKNSMFSPSNTDSIYYGKMANAIIKPFVKIADGSWEPLGKFYTFKWDSELNSQTANVVARDELSNLASKQFNFQLKQDLSYIQAFETLFNSIGITAIIDPSITGSLNWLFFEESNYITLQRLAEASKVIVTTNRLGQVTVTSILNKTIRAIITDADQIHTVATSKGMIRNYENIVVKYDTPQLEDNLPLVALLDFLIEAGTNIYDKIDFTNKNANIVKSVNFNPGKSTTELQNYTCTNESITLTIENASSSNDVAAITVHGEALNSSLHSTVATGADKVYAYINKFIQNSTLANSISTLLHAFQTVDTMGLRLTTRGNLKFQVGDVLQISSSRYAINFKGLITKADYTYAGGLKCNLEVINYSVIEGSA